MENKRLSFILASASPRRKELVGYLNIPFIILTKNIPEVSHFTDPVDFSTDISQQKGKVIFEEQLQELQCPQQ